MDAIALTGIITGVTGLVIAILTHIRHSECCRGFIEFETREINRDDAPAERVSLPPTPSTIPRSTQV
jgi:hypothetical protein